MTIDEVIKRLNDLKTYHNLSGVYDFQVYDANAGETYELDYIEYDTEDGVVASFHG